MERIAFVVEPLFASVNGGVRNYFLALQKLLAQRASVELVMCYKTHEVIRHWFRLHPRSPKFLDAGRDDGYSFHGSPKAVMAQYLSARHNRPNLSIDDFHFSQIGGKLQDEGYSTIVLTNPWMIDLDRTYSEMTVGLVYDVVPNEFVFARAEKPYGFAARHVNGFEYYQRNCNAILAISEDSAAAYNRYFGHSGPSALALPPLCPASYHVPPALSEPPIPGGIALACPFDLRKGLKEIPNTLNCLTDDSVHLNIFGAPRCSKADLRDFFCSLKVKHVNWWPAASAAQVRSIFLRSKVLFFPSHQEGLGLPILEAQMCGCPAVVRDVEPMRSLLCRQSRTFSNDGSDAADQILAILSAGADQTETQDEAYVRFAPERVAGVFWNSASSNRLQATNFSTKTASAA